MNKNRIYVAKLGKTVGLKGDLKLFIDSDFPNQFKKGATFSTNKNLTLKIQDYNSNRETIRFEEFNDVDQAKKLTNQELYVSLENTKENCKLENNQYFWFDLIDCSLIEDGKKLGIVKDVQRLPLDDYMEISTDESLVKEGLPKIFLIPFIMENYILSVDLDNKIIKTNNCFEILENS